MNQAIAQVEDVLIEELKYNMNKKTTASYIEHRRASSWMPQGGNQYSPSGVTRISFKLSSDSPAEFLDQSSVLLSFKIRNNLAVPLVLCNKPHAFFNEVRLYSNGVLIDQLQNFGRVITMFEKLTPTARNKNEDIYNYELTQYGAAAADTAAGRVAAITNNRDCVIAASATRTVLMYLPFGLFLRELYLPLKAGNFTLEFDLIQNVGDIALLSGTAVAADGTNGNLAIAATAADDVTPTLSNSFQLEDVKIFGDVVVMNSEISNSFVQLMLQGRTLWLEYTSYFSFVQSITNTNPTIVINRSLTRIKEIYISFTHTAHQNKSPLKFSNSFRLPASTANFELGNIQLQIQVGSKLYPETYPLNSLPLYYANLEKCYGFNYNSLIDNGLDRVSYKSDAVTVGVPATTNSAYTNFNSGGFIIGFNFEKCINASWTGLNNKTGEPIVIMLKGIDTTLVNIAHVVITYDAFVGIKDIGSEAYD